MAIQEPTPQERIAALREAARQIRKYVEDVCRDVGRAQALLSKAEAKEAEAASIEAGLRGAA